MSASDAMRRLLQMADTIDLNYHLVELGPQVAEDIRKVALELDARSAQFEPSFEDREAQAAYDDFWRV